MRKYSLRFALVLSLALPAPALAFGEGEWVLAQWKGSEFWFPGVVRGASGGKITIHYDDGTVETRPENQVRPYDWSVGTRVECNFQNQGKWYAGRIAALNNAKALIHYDDGDKENTTTGRCRSR